MDEYVEAVLAGRSDVQRPQGLPRRLNVRREPPTRGGAAELTITLPYLTAFSVLPFSLGLLAAAALAYGWHLALAAERWWVALLATPFIGIYAWVRLSSVFDRLLVRAGEAGVFVQQSRVWPKIEVSLAADDLRQLFAVRTGNSYGVVARKADGTAVPLVRGLRTGELAVYLERQIEQVLKIVDRPEANELARDAPLPRPASRLKALIFDGMFLATIVGVPLVLSTMCGSELGELAVGDEPTEISFEAKRAGRVYFTSEIDLTDNQWRYREDIPRSFTVKIQLMKSGRQHAELECDPFEVFVWVSGSHKKHVDSFWGPMQDCAVQLEEPGTYTLRAWRVWKPAMPRLRLDESKVAPRQD